MVGILRPRLSCFYCNTRTSLAKDGRTRKFDCPNCAATNYLDKNGDITDPPSTPTTRHTESSAHALPRQTSPTSHLKDDQDNLFCKTCIKNQHLLTTCLSEYLPSEDDPEYEKYEAQYPQYRKDLERRYPQVCPQCAPKVQERLRKTGYAAKVDFLTKNLERSKAFQSTATTSASTRLMIAGLNLVAFVWWVSVLYQMFYHALGLLGMEADIYKSGQLSPSMIVGCVTEGIRARFLPGGCEDLLSSLLRLVLSLSVLTLWWNPAMKDRVRHPHRMNQSTGFVDFYRFQAIILALRLAAAWKLPLLQDGKSNDLIRGAHGCMLAFLFLGVLASQRMIAHNPTPKISFKDNSGPLVDPADFQYPNDTFTSQPSALSPSRQPFSISSLGSRHEPTQSPPPTSTTTTNAAPTPPPDTDPNATDSMDWEPIPQTQQSTQPPIHSPEPLVPSFLRPAPSFTGPIQKSPFTGRLPPAPISPAHRLRNPPLPPQFKPTPLSKQANFFAQMGLSSAALPTLSSRPKPSTTISDSMRGEEAVDAGKENRRGMGSYVTSVQAGGDVFRPAQWTLQSDLDNAAKGTGLEDMFSSAFSIGNGSPVRTRAGARTGGDGREVLEPVESEREREERNGRVAGEDGARGRVVVDRNIRAARWPIVFAGLAVSVAVFREEAVRAWATEILAQSIEAAKDFF